MSYIKYIKAYNSPVIPAWSVDACRAYRQLDVVGRCGFMLEQSCILRYMFLVYGGALPNPLRNYAKCIQRKLSDLINQTSSLDLSDMLYIRCANMVEICKRLLNGEALPDPIDVKKMLRFALGSSAEYPRVFTEEASCNSFYDAFLSYLCPEAVRSGYSVTSGCCIPTFHLDGHTITINYEAGFTSYKMNPSIQNTLLQNHVIPNTFFEFLGGYNWGTANWFSILVGILSSYSFGLDSSWLYVDQKDTQILDESEVKFKLTTRMRSSSDEAKLYTALRRATLKFVPSVKSPFDSLETTANSSFRRLFVSFLIGLRRMYSTALDDGEIRLLGEIVGADPTEIASFFKAPESASAEAYEAFKDSVFSDFKEFYPENRIPVEEPPRPFVRDLDIASLKENLKALREHSAAITGPAPFMDAKKETAVDDSSDSQSATGNDLSTLDTSDMPDAASIDGSGNAGSEAGLGANESGDSGATGDELSSGTKSDQDDGTSTPELGDDPSSSKTSDSDSSRSKISMHPVPDLPNVSDKEGVKLELTSSESTDTVFYRIELKSYLDSIISNPPKTISQQKLQVLRRIESFWLNILTPQCIYDLIDSVIKLPSMFKIHKAKQK